MKEFNDLEPLNRYIEEIVMKSLEEVTKKVTEILKQAINSEFYAQYNPKIYQRTYDLISACTEVNPHFENGEIVCGVVIDPNKLTSKEWENGNFKGITNGIDHDLIIDWAINGIHGNPNIQTYGRPLEYAINQILTNNDIISELRSNGLDITVE